MTTQTHDSTPARRSGRRLGGTGLVVAAGLAALGAGLLGAYADSVTSWTPGLSGEADGDDALGAPTGGGLFSGSADVATLGVQGQVVLHLDEACVNGPGTDLIVFENAFYIFSSPELAFVEALSVEVSSNGAAFAAFPTEYTGPAVLPAPFAGVNPEWFHGFAGVLPVSADPTKNVDPIDVVAAGGDAFDLADLVDDPLVIAGSVDLDAIRWVRLTDVAAGVDLDHEGNTVYDAGLSSNAAADLDALVVVNHVTNLIPQRPAVDLTLDDTGLLTLVIEDLNGIATVVPGLTASANGYEFDFYTVLPLFLITELTPTRATLVIGPIPPGFFEVILKVSARDGTGHTSGDAVHIR